MAQVQFVANENKAIIWSLLQGHGAFEGLPDNMFPAITADFERIIRKLQPNAQAQTLLELNKLAISDMLDELVKYKPAMQLGQVQQLGQVHGQKQQQGQMQFKQKEKEFAELINAPLPEKIDFADAAEVDNSDMAKKLAEAIAWREKEFKQFLQAPPPTKNVTRTLHINEEVPSDEALIGQVQVLDQVLGQGLAQVLDQVQVLDRAQVLGQGLVQDIAVSPLTVLNKKVNFVEEVTVMPEYSVQMEHEITLRQLQVQMQRIEEKLDILLQNK